MSTPYKEILQRAWDTITKPEAEKPEWKNPKNDAINLALLVKRLVGDVHRYHKMVPEQMRHDDLCPVCAGYTWGRPSGNDSAERDYTRRMCSDCGEIRDEPPGVQA